MRSKTIIKIIAITEISIGLSTILGLLTYILLSLSTKSLNVFIFVLVSAIISSILGIGLFYYKNWARTLLLFFSGYIVLTKIMCFFNLLHFNGDIIIFISSRLKNSISIIYHVLIIAFLNWETVRKIFIKNETSR